MQGPAILVEISFAIDIGLNFITPFHNAEGDLEHSPK